MQSVFVDENGELYGVKHVGNKPRVSAMSYTYDIAEGNVPDHEAYNKFGQNSAVGARLEDIWDGAAVYEYLADDTFATMYISSSDSDDQSITYEVTGVDSDYSLSTVTVTLDASDGQTFVPLTSGAADDKWWRIFRVRNSSSTPAVGDIYVSKDNTDTGPNGIPDNAADIQAKILIGKEQTLMALMTIPNDCCKGYMTSFYASTSVVKATQVEIYVRPFGGVFNVKGAISINAGYAQHKWDFPVPVEAKSDIAIRASASGGGGIVTAGFDMWLEEVSS